MKKFCVFLLTLAYLVFSTGSLSAETTIQENKDFQETIFSVKGAESASSHFFKAPKLKNTIVTAQNQLTKFVYCEPVGSVTSHLLVPIFLLNCNFRR